MKPGIPPEGIATLLAETTKVAPATSPVTPATSTPVTPPAADTSKEEVEAAPASTGVAAEAPAYLAVEAYIKPLLAKGITMIDLRRKIGSEKGKQWTAMLNEVVGHAIQQANQHMQTPAIYRSNKTTYHTTMGCIVASIRKLPRSSEGNIAEAWETKILCSNPKGASSAVTKDADNVERKLLPKDATGAEQVVQLVLP